MAKVKVTQVEVPDRPERAPPRHAARARPRQDRPQPPSTTRARCSQACCGRSAHLVKVEEPSMAEAAEPLEPPACAGAGGPQARRPRPGLGQGPLLRPRDQGPEVARGLAQDARRVRGRPDADLHAHRQAARRDVQGRDADRPVPHRRRMPVNVRDLDRFDAGAEVTPESLVEKRPDQEHEDAT